ncbi:hypothetical protein NPIL_584521 [Nephila pilipes]|uniref:EGF-like domain-containing protein n=1 Tax=Nephila pilipes TaxID=299642 RepID=A0A8X6QAW8_NEPPI|nr:hypothetical protein NPIL_584521 [Nephila pilipes]
MCECRNGTKGDFCELIVGCQELNCDAEISNCILNDETHRGMCICKEDNKLYFDNKCVLDSCLSNPCRNGGTCGIAKDGFRCVCKPPYSGTLCENAIFKADALLSAKLH